MVMLEGEILSAGGLVYGGNGTFDWLVLERRGLWGRLRSGGLLSSLGVEGRGLFQQKSMRNCLVLA